MGDEVKVVYPEPVHSSLHQLPVFLESVSATADQNLENEEQTEDDVEELPLEVELDELPLIVEDQQVRIALTLILPQVWPQEHVKPRSAGVPTIFGVL